MRRGSLTVSALLVFTLAVAIALPAAATSPTTNPSPPAHTTIPVRTGWAGIAPAAPGSPARPKVGPNVNVSDHPDAQSEASIAVDPTDPNHVLAGVNNLYEPDGLTAKVYESFDRGQTWIDTMAIPGGFCYDTWLDFAADGTAYLAYECLDQRVAIKPPDSPGWINLKLANAGILPDRDMVVTDDDPSSPFSGSAYIGYDDALEGEGNAAHVIYSRDGLVWLQSEKINDAALTIGVNAAVAPTGAVYAVWEDFDNGNIWVDRSADGGATWGTDDLVTHYRLDTSSFFIPIPPQPERGIVPMPFSAVAPGGTGHAGRLYVTYTDRAVAGSDTDIFLRYSDDGGQTWSSERRINDDAVHAWQFHPSIAVAPNGLVAVSFYDTRNDPTDGKTDRYISFSRDGGATWSRNLKITTAMSDETNSPDGNDYGDYQGLAAGKTLPGVNFFFAAWTDSRPGTQAEDLFAAGVKP